MNMSPGLSRATDLVDGVAWPGAAFNLRGGQDGATGATCIGVYWAHWSSWPLSAAPRATYKANRRCKVWRATEFARKIWPNIWKHGATRFASSALDRVRVRFSRLIWTLCCGYSCSCAAPPYRLDARSADELFFANFVPCRTVLPSFKRNVCNSEFLTISQYVYISNPIRKLGICLCYISNDQFISTFITEEET